MIQIFFMCHSREFTTGVTLFLKLVVGITSMGLDNLILWRDCTICVTFSCYLK